MGKGARVRLAAFATLAISMAMVLGVSVAAIHLGACLPDPDTAPIDGGAEAGVDGGDGGIISTRACGDGFIDPGAGDGGEECDPGQGAPGCSSSCKVDCPGGVIDPTTHHCYFSSSSVDGENDAVGACGAPNLRAHVVTFASDDEAAFVSGAGFDAGYWVGLTYESSKLGYQSAEFARGEPGWIWPQLSTACPGCYARTGDAGNPYFAPLTADSGSPDCVYAASQDAWGSSPCNGAMHPVLCEREPPGSRATPCNGYICITVAKTRKRYLVGVTPVTAADAVTSCQQLGASGSLVLFDSREEREEVAREIMSYAAGTDLAESLTTFWVGLGTNAAGALQWDDGADAGARPPILGLDAGPAGASRVFLSVDVNNPFDQGTGHGDAPSSTHLYVCQY